MASEGAGASGKGKAKAKANGKRKRDNEMGHGENAEHTYGCNCGFPDDGLPSIWCDTCESWYHGWCVDLREEDFLWFDKFACPDCVKKGKRSTRSNLSNGITNVNSNAEYPDLFWGEIYLWNLVTTSVASRPTRHIEWTCKKVMKIVESSIVGQLESEHPHVKLLELIIGYLHYFMIPMGEPQMLALLDFHKDLVLRFLKAVPQTMRLWGWNQMRGLIALTHGHYWSPKAIRVEGAGCPELDGVYRVSPDTQRSAHCVSRKTLSIDMPMYTRKGGEHLLSLNLTEAGETVWCISRLDTTGPGTSQDECYSFQASSPAENLMPPCGVKWEAADGVEPPPIGTLVAEEGYLSPDGKEMETLEGKLARWMVKNQVVKKIFDEPNWLKVVNGSTELLEMMARMEGLLTPFQISLMWCWVVKMGPELQTAANEVLATLVLGGKPAMVAHLFRSLQERVVEVNDAWVDWGRCEDVLMFLTELVNNPGHRILRRLKNLQMATKNLVWSLLRGSKVLSHQSGKAVSTLLASVVYTSNETLNDQEELQRFLERCISSWQNSSGLLDSVSSVHHMLEKFELKHIRQLARLFDTDRDRINVGGEQSEAESEEQEPDRTNSAKKAKAARFPDTLRQAECDICLSPDLLDNMNTDMFGVTSWRCKCTQIRMAHSRCIMSHNQAQLRGRMPCPHCKKDMSFGKTSPNVSRLVHLKVHDASGSNDDPHEVHDAVMADDFDTRL